MTAATGTRTATQWIEYIVATHHSYLRRELPFFAERLAKMTANHGTERPELFVIQRIMRDLTADLMTHLQKEEMVLFPYISQMEEAIAAGLPIPRAPFPSVRFPVRMMVMEHDNAEGFLEQLRDATLNYTPPDGACGEGREFYARLAALEPDLREHIRLENDILFPRAIEMEETGG